VDRRVSVRIWLCIKVQLRELLCGERMIESETSEDGREREGRESEKGRHMQVVYFTCACKETELYASGSS